MSFAKDYEPSDYRQYKTTVWDPLSFLRKKENLTVSREEIPVEIVNHHPAKQRGMEVGDDRVDLSFSYEQLKIQLTVQELVLGMKTSIEDTSITRGPWNFTEVTGILPHSKEQSFDMCRKGNSFQNLSFIDVPRLRLIIDVTKGAVNFSNSKVGKSSMLARDTNGSRREFKENIQLSSFLQDSYLNTVDMTEPKYLPKVMGGSGAAVPFGNPLNLYSYVKLYKHGTYERVYGTATAELQHVISELENRRVAEPWLCSKLRDKQEYLHGTYAEKVFIPRQEKLVSPFWEVPPPLYKAAGTSSGVSGVENRLIAAKRLITDKKAGVMIDQKDRLLRVLLGEESVISMDLAKRRSSQSKRSEVDGALTANAAFQRLLRRTANDSDVSKLISDRNFLPVNYGQRHFTFVHAEWLSKGGKGEILNITDIQSSSDMYLFEDFAVENSLRIEGIALQPLLNHGISVVRETKRKIGLYEISSSQEVWADKIIADLKDSRDRFGPLTSLNILDLYSKDPEWINDDSLIIANAIRDVQRHTNVTLALISDDNRLGKQLAKSTNCKVIRFALLDILRNIEREIWTSTSKVTVEELTGIISDRDMSGIEIFKVYTDSGSLASAARSLGQEVDAKGVKHIYRKEFLSGSYEPRRTTIYKVTELPGLVNGGTIGFKKHNFPRKISRYNSLESISGSRRMSGSEDTTWSRSTGLFSDYEE